MKTKTIKIKNIISIIAIFALLIGFYSDVFAQSLGEVQERIDELSQEIENSQSHIEELRQKENTLQNQLAILNAESRQIQSEINTTQAEIDRTKADIREKEAELARTKEMIQENAKTLYKQGNPSTIEILFSSENFTDFINRREYLDRVKANLNDAAREAVLLKEELEEKEAELEIRSDELSGQRRQLDIRQEEQRQLIEETRGEEARYQRKMKEDEAAKKAADREFQRILCERSGGTFTNGNCVLPTSFGGDIDFGQGSYPYANNCMNPYLPPSGINSSNCTYTIGGYYDRQCTSYAFWRRGNMGRAVPGWWGNAGNWAQAASSQGFQVNSTPKKGAIGVVGSGSFGHNFIVEEVLDSNRMIISQYNDPTYNGGRWGEFSKPTVNIGHFAGAQYIHDRI